MLGRNVCEGGSGLGIVVCEEISFWDGVGGSKNDEEKVRLEVSCGARLLWTGKASGSGSELPDGNVWESSEPAEITERGRACTPAAFFGLLVAGFCVFLGVTGGRELGAEANVAWDGPRFALGTLSVAVQGQTIDTSLVN